MLLTIITVWAVIIPVAVLAFSWQAAKRREAGAARAHARAAAEDYRVLSPRGATPPCASRPARPRRTVTRRVCPEHAHGAGRRPASA